MSSELLKQAGIEHAIIVDDAYDTVPKADDLGEDEWDIFLADVAAHDETLRSIYPESADSADSQLRKDDTFTSLIWKNRKKFPPEIVDPLFNNYELETASDKINLKRLTDKLKEMGLTVKTAGRNFETKAQNVDLIVIDLFFGIPQKNEHKEKSVRELSKVISNRAESPPAIILMSNNPHLHKSSDWFRDNAKIFEASFKTLKKSEFKSDHILPKLLRDIARNRKDALKLAKFVSAWRSSLHNAFEQTENDIRRLDLHDWAQINDLLLKAEEVGTGSYILDVFDRVLQYEIERDKQVIKAALALDTLNRDQYPAMATATSRDTLSILVKSLYQHPERQRLNPPNGYPVAFGDIVGLKKGLTEGTSIFKGRENTVFMVISPACDLVRKKSASHALLIAGNYETLNEAVTGNSSPHPQTVVLELKNKQKVKVKWDPADITSLTRLKLNNLLGTKGSGEVIARLREGPATSVQQEILSKLGRIGTVAPLPSTFAAEVQLYFVNTEGVFERIAVKNNDPIMAVCYVGRDGNGKKKTRIALDPHSYFDTLEALINLDLSDIHQGSSTRLKKIAEPRYFDQLFARGIEVELNHSAPREWALPKEEGAEKFGKIVYRTTPKDAFSNPQTCRSLPGLIVCIQTQEE